MSVARARSRGAPLIVQPSTLRYKLAMHHRRRRAATPEGEIGITDENVGNLGEAGTRRGSVRCDPFPGSFAFLLATFRLYQFLWRGQGCKAQIFAPRFARDLKSKQCGPARKRSAAPPFRGLTTNWPAVSAEVSISSERRILREQFWQKCKIFGAQVARAKRGFRRGTGGAIRSVL